MSAKKCACGSYCPLPERLIHRVRRALNALKGDYGSITISEVPYCWECGDRAYFHRNIGAGILWCPDCGALASMRPERTPREDRFGQMTDDKYEEFVENDGDTE